MKIIYDTNQPEEKRIEFVGNDGESYFGFYCYQIMLDDGAECAKIARWGNQKERDAIIKKYEALLKKPENIKSKKMGSKASGKAKRRGA